MRGAGRVYVVGAGRVGTAIAGLLARAGDASAALAGLWALEQDEAARATEVVGAPCAWGAFPESIAAAQTVIISVSDPHVPAVAGALLDGGLLRGCAAALHCGGFRPAAEALACLGTHLPCGTLHPLLSVASPEQALRLLPGAHVGLEGAPEAMQAARSICTALGSTPFELPPGEDMGLYHAAAVMASNHAVALWNDARDLMQRAGLAPAQVGEVLLPLLRSVVENVATEGYAGALTGPVARGDASTVARQIDLLRRRAPELEPLYRAGTAAALRAAPGLTAAQRQALSALLEKK